MDELEKAKAERDQHLKYAIDANEILRDLWNAGAMDKFPGLKARAARLMDVLLSSRTV